MSYHSSNPSRSKVWDNATQEYAQLTMINPICISKFAISNDPLPCRNYITSTLKTCIETQGKSVGLCYGENVQDFNNKFIK